MTEGRDELLQKRTCKKLHGLFMPPTGFFLKYLFNQISCRDHACHSRKYLIFAREAVCTARPADNNDVWTNIAGDVGSCMSVNSDNLMAVGQPRHPKLQIRTEF